MTGTQAGLIIAVFIACAVEATEALTIVMAVGVTRSWRSALTGVGAALLALAALTAALGPALTALPINVLRGAVGGLLLVFGLQWLRKAILRAGGLKSRHDESAAYAKQSRAAGDAGPVEPGIDPYAFLVAFKGTLLEGLEVIFIVLTFGSNQRDVPLAAATAAAAVLVMVSVGVLIRVPLARLPENSLKFVVGVMLTSFGTFWGAEGVHAHWPGGELALPVLIAGYLMFALLTVAVLRRLQATRDALASKPVSV